MRNLCARTLHLPKHEREALARDRRTQRRRARRAWRREAAYLVSNYGMVVIEPETLAVAR